MPAPAPRNLTAADVVRLIAQLKQSEQAKTACGRRLIALYDRYAGRKP